MRNAIIATLLMLAASSSFAGSFSDGEKAIVDAIESQTTQFKSGISVTAEFPPELLESLERIETRLDALTILSCLSLGSLSFVHFGRFMRW